MPLVVVLGLNSAIAALYYLRLVAVPMLDDPEPGVRAPVPTPYFSRPLAGLISAGCVVVLIFFANTLMEASGRAASTARPDVSATAPDDGATHDTP